MSLKKKAWPVGGKVWEGTDFRIGLTAPLKNLDIQTVSSHHVLTLCQSGYKCKTGYTASSVRDVLRSGGDVSLTRAGTETITSTEFFPSVVFVSSDSNFEGRLAQDFPQVKSLEDTSIEGFKSRDFKALSCLFIKFLSSDGFGGNLKAEALVNLLLAEYISASSPKKKTFTAGGLSAVKLNRVKDFINENSEKNISLKTLASIADISSYHFLRTFKSETGVTPHQYVIERRVERAKALLADKRLTLAEIAYSVGFSSQSHMTDCFRRFVGATPGKFRKILLH